MVLSSFEVDMGLVVREWGKYVKYLLKLGTGIIQQGAGCFAYLA
jgi:hypothetical protein